MSGAKHFNDLPNAKTIHTEAFLRASRCVDDCIQYDSLGVVVGEAGFGKTFAVEAALTDSPKPVVKTLFSYQATPREVARKLLEEATGVSQSGTRFDLADDCVDVLRTPHVAVIDEAQHLNRDCAFFLRYLLDHPETRVALILVGGDGCWERVARDPMLRSRVYRRVVFRELGAKVLFKALPGYHPIYAGITEDLIAELYTRCRIGHLRTLAIFTHTALMLCEEAGVERINDEIVTKALKLIADDVQL